MWNFLRRAVVGLSAAMAAAACTSDARLVVPHTTADEGVSLDVSSLPNSGNPNSAAGDEKGFIHGWFDGQTVMLRYSRLYFCAEPPTSAVSTHCEIGATSTVAPRAGPFPTLYVLAPQHFNPPAGTLHCPGGTVCLNHPPNLDLSRVGGPDSVHAPPHSHILADQQAGWHQAVVLPVLTLDAWNDIAAAKSLAKVRELQAAGGVGPDTRTNIYFFFEVQGTNP
jgi:hypothetical protein